MDATCFGPRVMVVGNTDTGKSTMVRIFASYAARLDYCPIVVDLDPGQNSLTLPGAMGAALVDKKCLDPAQGFVGLQPLVFCTGSNTPGKNTGVYRAALKALSSGVRKLLEVNETVRQSGCIINTCGWTEDTGLDLIKESILAFAPDVILVMVGGSLLANIQRYVSTLKVSQGHGMWKADGGGAAGDSTDWKTDSRKPEIAVRKLAASDGIVARTRDERRISRERVVTKYFFGNREALLKPSILDIPVKDITVLRLDGNVTSSAHLPVGIASALSGVRVEEVDVVGKASALLNDIWAVALSPPG